jgi:DNA polymerase-1
MSAPTLIIDSTFIAYRARHAMKYAMLNWKGKQTGTVFGFLRETTALMERFQTKKLIFCFDSRHSKRKEIYPPYKAKRNKYRPEEDPKEVEAFHKQVRQLRREILPGLGFKNVFIQKGYEADDLIASICQASSPDQDYIIITADEDFYQCLRGHISIYNPKQKAQLTLQKFYRIYSIKPQQWVLVKAMAGCTSDNIPGILRVGESKSLEYLRGELKKTNEKGQWNGYYLKIKKGIETEEYKTFLKLVKLPFEGTKTPIIRKDDLTKDKWKAINKSTGIMNPKIPSILKRNKI